MGWVVNVTPRPLYSLEKPGTHCVGGWVGLRVGLDKCGKSRPPPGFDPWTFQPVVNRYTDWAIPAPSRARTVFYIRAASECRTLINRSVTKSSYE